MQYGLEDKNIKEITNVFAAEKDILRVIIFGARTEGDFGPSAPVNLAIAGLDMMADELPELEEELNELGMNIKFNMVLLNTISNPDLLHYIQTTGKALYKKA